MSQHDAGCALARQRGYGSADRAPRGARWDCRGQRLGDALSARCARGARQPVCHLLVHLHESHGIVVWPAASLTTAGR